MRLSADSMTLHSFNALFIARLNQKDFFFVKPLLIVKYSAAVILVVVNVVVTV